MKFQNQEDFVQRLSKEVCMGEKLEAVSRWAMFWTLENLIQEKGYLQE